MDASNQKPFVPVRFAVLTVSDTRSLEEDRSGSTLQERIEGAGHVLADRAICTDDRRKIRAIVKRWIADPEVDVIITTGGTGFTGRDVTPDAVEPLFEKRMDGFSVVFHRISYDSIGTSTIQSRATAGLVNNTFVFCLPGSPGACRDAWDAILVKQFDYRQDPCNFVEIMPRLDEHLKRTKLKAPAKRRKTTATRKRSARAPAGRSPARGRGRR
jgi:molybdenum cofactor biosynthesis protein B